jgi:hypothetical protein
LNAQRAKLANGETVAPIALAADAPQQSDESKSNELAAWILVCRSLLNLDETITKG